MARVLVIDGKIVRAVNMNILTDKEISKTIEKILEGSNRI